ncbi:MAG TPA: hypothetical protein VJ085_03470, partial [Candidatus Acidoferrales bacterium]|nr:hypothetical protein [Candidatus Acidoferrales bacterium]
SRQPRRLPVQLLHLHQEVARANSRGGLETRGSESPAITARCGWTCLTYNSLTRRLGIGFL